MIQNIIFDFGGVILKHRATIMEEMLARMFSISVEEAEKVWSKERLLIMSGKKSSKEFLSEFKEKLQSDKPLEELMREWKEFYVEHAKNVDWDLLEFIEELKNKYKVYLFTDTIDVNDEYNSTRGIYEKFTAVFKSYEEGFTKYSDEAFLNVLNKIDARPEECVFIDDLEININRAQALGIKGVIYTNKEELIQRLSDLGVK